MVYGEVTVIQCLKCYNDDESPWYAWRSDRMSQCYDGERPWYGEVIECLNVIKMRG